MRILYCHSHYLGHVKKPSARNTSCTWLDRRHLIWVIVSTSGWSNIGPPKDLERKQHLQFLT